MSRPVLPRMEEVRGLRQTARGVVSESWIDMFGHMNVMWYTHLFSEAMGGVSALMGLTHDYMAANDLGTFALKLHVDYIAELRVDTPIALHTRFLERNKKTLRAIHYLVNETDGQIAATGEVLNAFIDMRVRRMTDIPGPIGANLDELIGADSALGWAPDTCAGLAM